MFFYYILRNNNLESYNFLKWYW